MYYSKESLFAVNYTPSLPEVNLSSANDLFFASHDWQEWNDIEFDAWMGYVFMWLGGLSFSLIHIYEDIKKN